MGVPVYTWKLATPSVLISEGLDDKRFRQRGKRLHLLPEVLYRRPCSLWLKTNARRRVADDFEEPLMDSGVTVS